MDVALPDDPEEALPITVQVFVLVQEYKFPPAEAALLKYNWPMVQVDGSDVPTVTGRVMGIAEKSGFLPWVLRLTVVAVCADAIQQIRGNSKSRETVEKSSIFIEVSNVCESRRAPFRSKETISASVTGFRGTRDNCGEQRGSIMRILDLEAALRLGKFFLELVNR